MSVNHVAPDPATLASHAIIVGFGVPGRAAADEFKREGVPYCVIELNPETVRRCGHTGVPIIEGHAADEGALRRAGIERATLLVLAVPDEPAVLAAVPVARRLNPAVRIIARCNYTSAGMTARTRGADEVIVAEQVVAVAIAGAISDARIGGSAPAPAAAPTVP
jgi:CPA2 family monovalent cation:H+ antiporter-2